MAEQKSNDTNRVVLISGASKGFGFLVAQLLTKLGYKVYGGSRSKPTKAFDYNYVELDVTKQDQIKSAVADIVKKEGKIDVLINNAGINLPAQTVSSTPLDDYRRIMEVNYFGLIALTQEVLPVLLKNDNQAGHIINVSSCISLVAFPFFSAYTATKAAVDRLTESLYNELSSTNVKVQVISPGPSNTEFDKEFGTKLAQITDPYKEPLNNFLQNGPEFRKKFNVDPKDVAALIVKMVNQEEDAKDYRTYPGPSADLVKFLNADFKNNYQHNVEFGARFVQKKAEKADQ